MVAFTVYGKPQPQGSSSGFIVGRSGGNLGVAITSNNKALKPWRQQVSQMALITLVEAGLARPYAAKHVPVEVEYTFYLDRPPSIPKKRTELVVKPDIDKLVRGCTDALTGFLFADDAQVVKVTARKLYGSPSRTEIVVRKPAEDTEPAKEKEAERECMGCKFVNRNHTIECRRSMKSAKENASEP